MKLRYIDGELARTGLPRRLLAALTVAVLALLPGCVPTNADITRTVVTMSTVAIISASGDEADEACDAVTERLREFESATSRFADNSDISLVNAAAGKSEIEIGEDCYIMLTAARDYAHESDGAYDVTIGALSSLWGIGTDEPRLPSPEEIEAVRALIGIDGLELSEREGKYFAKLTRESMALDLGGCAKGYALDLCRAEFDKYDVDYGYVSLGGNVMLYGDKSGAGFKTGVRYPEQSSSGSVCVLKLADTNVATTGGYERFFEADGVSYHHVLDPATGYPAKSDILSATSVCPGGMRGDYLSTRLFMLGLDGALELMRSREVEAVIIAQGNKVYISRSLEGAFVAEGADGSYTFEFV